MLLIVGFLGKGVLRLDDRQLSSFPEKGLVTAVYDGDTIKVRFDNGNQRRIRLIGISAPEIEDSRDKVKFAAYMSKRFTFFHLYNKKIGLSYDWQLEDKYGRLLAYIWTERTGLFNKFILKEGFASVFVRFPFRNDYREEFIEAERKARNLGKGMWRKEPYFLVSLKEVNQHIGRIVSIVYKCHKLDTKGNFLFLRSPGREFSALIPLEKLSLFPKVKSLKGKIISVTGFLELYKGQPQMVIFLPHQIELKEQISYSHSDEMRATGKNLDLESELIFSRSRLPCARNFINFVFMPHISPYSLLNF